MDIKSIKHEFMAFRNGIIADTLRKAGSPFEIIFGLQLPQMKQIASQARKDRQLAEQLWADRKVRESRILALMLIPPEDVSFEEALSMTCDLRTREEADLLPFLLLRNTPHIPEIITILQSESSITLSREGNNVTENSKGENPVNPDLLPYIIEALSRFL